MKIKIGINGFGRIGRNAFKIAFERPDIEITAVNDLTDTKTLAHLLKHDSNYGTYQHDVSYDDENIIVNGQPVKVLAVKDPAELPWGDLGVQVVIESTGLFTKHDDLKKHIAAGAKKVILSAPEKDDNDHDTFVIGVNEQNMKPEHQIFSNASCTTNCITPVASIIESNFGIEKAMMTTVHSYTASQRLQDAPAKDLREARNAAENIVPTSTGASIAAAKALPALEGIFEGLSVRVPTPVVSLADFAIVTKKPVTKEEVNEAFKKAAADLYFQGILDATEEELVSSDFIGNSHSAIVDLKLTNVVGGNLLKVVVWYDNEWGYSNRLVELTADVGKLLDANEGEQEVNDNDQGSQSAQDQSDASEDPKPEGILEEPKLDDALPAPEPMGQESNEPVHQTEEQHQPVEGEPGPETPADTLPQQDTPPSIFPPSAGPDQPHEF